MGEWQGWELGPWPTSGGCDSCSSVQHSLHSGVFSMLLLLFSPPACLSAASHAAHGIINKSAAAPHQQAQFWPASHREPRCSPRDPRRSVPILFTWKMFSLSSFPQHWGLSPALLPALRAHRGSEGTLGTSSHIITPTPPFPDAQRHAKTASCRGSAVTIPGWGFLCFHMVFLLLSHKGDECGVLSHTSFSHLARSGMRLVDRTGRGRQVWDHAGSWW